MTTAKKKSIKGTVQKLAFFTKDIFIVKKADEKNFKKRFIWFNAAVLAIPLTACFIFLESNPVIEAILVFFLVYFIAWQPISRMECRYCGNRNWFGVWNQFGVFWVFRLHSSWHLVCPECDKKLF